VDDNAERLVEKEITWYIFFKQAPGMNEAK